MACDITVPGMSNCILLEIMYCISTPNNILLAFGKKIYNLVISNFPDYKEVYPLSLIFPNKILMMHFVPFNFLGKCLSLCLL